jgi:branched-chain amino acid transport system substrate-binding protein
VIALAAEQAGSTDPTAIRDAMIDVTGGGTKCTTFEECKGLLEGGDDIDYDGVSGPLDFVDAGEPSVGSYDVFGWDAEGVLSTLDTVRTDELQ